MFARVTTYHADEDTDRLLEGFKATGLDPFIVDSSGRLVS